MTADDSTTDTTSGAPAAGQSGTAHYEIRVKGHLGPRWAAWFDGLSLTNEDGGTTVIHGPLVDQAALHGVLQKLRDLGVSLVSLTQRPPDASTTEPRVLPNHEGN